MHLPTASEAFDAPIAALVEADPAASAKLSGEPSLLASEHPQSKWEDVKARLVGAGVLS